VKAAVYTRYGQPDVLHVQEAPPPEPGDHDLLIEVHATTANRTDRGFLRGDPFIVRFFSLLRTAPLRLHGTREGSQGCPLSL
jgi:NADPH:quinone reductase-like Zn-dependent oxidoreductase